MMTPTQRLTLQLWGFFYLLGAITGVILCFVLGGTV